jgi:hypothetical protein
MLRTLVVALALSLGLSGAPARPATYRLPQTGVPAFVIDAPQDWSAAYDPYGNLQLLAADRSASAQYSMIADPAVDTTPPETVAAQVFQSAHAAPYSRTEPGAVAGVPGEAFIGTLVIKGVSLDMRVTLAKLDPTHYACVTTLSIQNITPGQRAGLDALLARASIARH